MYNKTGMIRMIGLISSCKGGIISVKLMRYYKQYLKHSIKCLLILRALLQLDAHYSLFVMFGTTVLSDSLLARIQ